MNHENIHEKCVKKLKKKKLETNPANILLKIQTFLHRNGPIATGLLAKSATDKEPLSSKLSSTSCASNCKYCWENLKELPPSTEKNLPLLWTI